MFYLTKEHAASLAREAVESGLHPTLTQAIVFLVLLAVVVGLFRLLIWVGEEVENELEKQRSTKAHAHALCDRALLAEIKRVTDDSGQKGDREAALTSLDTIKELVYATYQTFESSYGQMRKGLERLDFEVTFMTKSLRDGHLTIPAAANKDGRMPRSLVLRAQNPDIYDRTVSAEVYRAPSPRIEIIPDTSVKSYNELYPSQKQRIKSSIVFPVLTPDYRLLGTLVVHCDKTAFFSSEKEKYFSDLLEIFAKRLALEAVRIERIAPSLDKGALPF